jgi:hypothetical protein
VEPPAGEPAAGRDDRARPAPSRAVASAVPGVSGERF